MMMETKDWMSGFIGLIVFSLGAIPLLEGFNVFNLGISQILHTGWFIAIVPYILAIAGFYLLIESIIEITNSNSIGYMSFLVGAVVMAVGTLPVLHTFGIGPDWFSLGFLSNPIIYQILFMVEGLFLMIAAFAMEL